MGTYTTNYNLFMPSIGEQGWGDLVNGNFSTLDSTIKGLDTRATALENADTTFDARITVLENGTFNDITANSVTADTLSGNLTKLIVPVTKTGTYMQIGTITYNTLSYSVSSTTRLYNNTALITDSIIPTVNKPNFIEFAEIPLPTTITVSYRQTCNWTLSGLASIGIYDEDNNLIYSHVVSTSYTDTFTVPLNTVLTVKFFGVDPEYDVNTFSVTLSAATENLYIE